MSLHLQPIEPQPVADPTTAGTVDTVFFVIQRQNGHWSPAAKIITVCDAEETAEAFAAQQKGLHPQQCFGVAMLRSEARPVAKPIEIVRTGGNA